MCCVARVSQSIGKTTETTQIYLYRTRVFELDPSGEFVPAAQWTKKWISWESLVKCWTELDPSRSRRIWPAATGNAWNATQWLKKMPNVWWCHPAVDKDHAQLLDSTITRPLGGGECVGSSLLIFIGWTSILTPFWSKSCRVVWKYGTPKIQGFIIINSSFQWQNRETQLLSLSSIFHCFVCVIGAACVCMPPRSYCSWRATVTSMIGKISSPGESTNWCETTTSRATGSWHPSLCQLLGSCAKMPLGFQQNRVVEAFVCVLST